VAADSWEYGPMVFDDGSTLANSTDSQKSGKSSEEQTLGDELETGEVPSVDVELPHPMDGSGTESDGESGNG